MVQVVTVRFRSASTKPIFSRRVTGVAKKYRLAENVEVVLTVSISRKPIANIACRSLDIVLLQTDFGSTLETESKTSLAVAPPSL